MTDPRDKRIAELEARVDKLVDAIAKLASERPTVVYPVAPYVPYVQPWVWSGCKTTYTGMVTISNPVVGGMDAQPVTVMPRPSPTMTVLS